MADTTYTSLSGDNVTIYVTITDSESNSTITWERQGENEAGFNVINTQSNVKYGGGTLLSPSLTIYNITGTDVGYVNFSQRSYCKSRVVVYLKFCTWGTLFKLTVVINCLSLSK